MRTLRKTEALQRRVARAADLAYKVAGDMEWQAAQHADRRAYWLANSKRKPAHRPWQRWQRFAGRVRVYAIKLKDRARCKRLLYCADKIDEWAEAWAIRGRKVLPETHGSGPARPASHATATIKAAHKSRRWSQVSL